MKKILSIFSTIIISLFFLSLFGWMVNQISTKNKKFGFVTEPIKFMYSFPDLFKQSVKEVKSLPRTYIKTYEHFEPVNKLKKDLIVLTTHSDTSDTRSIVLMNLKNDSILKRWKIENPWDEVARIVNPIYLPKDGSLIYNYYYTGRPGLIKLDSNGNEVWKNDSLVIHHGMNLGHDGNLWACSIYRGKASGKYNIAEKDVFYNDYRINKFDIETGQIIFDKSITEILNENNLSNYLFKSVSTTEPLHLNDVQPALKNTKYYKKDDVFISLRNIHAIMHYRPSTNQLIDLLEGPFINQHDVDFLNDSTLAIFNNNTFVEVSQKSRKAHKDTSRLTDAGKFYSNIVSYGFNNEQFNFIGDSVFKANRIFTKNEGLMEFLGPNTYFVEEQNPGLLWVIENNKVVLKHVLKSPYEGYHHLPNWTRIVQYGSKKF